MHPHSFWSVAKFHIFLSYESTQALTVCTDARMSRCTAEQIHRYHNYVHNYCCVHKTLWMCSATVVRWLHALSVFSTANCYNHCQLLPTPPPPSSTSSIYSFYLRLLLFHSICFLLVFHFSSLSPALSSLCSLHISLFILLNSLLSLTWDETEIHVYVANNNIQPVYILGINIWNNLRFHTTVQDSNSYLKNRFFITMYRIVLHLSINSYEIVYQKFIRFQNALYECSDK